MNILLINHYASYPELGMAYRPYYMAREWTKLGHKVTIVAASYSHLRRVQPNCKTRINRESIDGIDYIWLKTITYSGNGLGRVFSFFQFTFLLYLFTGRILKDAHPDSVIASSTYPLDIFPSLWMARRSGASLSFEVHDLWPLTPILLGGYSRYHPFICLLQYAENFAYKKADYVISMLSNAKSHMMEHGMDESKYIHVPNGFSEEETLHVSPVPAEVLTKIRQIKGNSHTLIGYAGGHGISHALHALIDIAKILEEYQNISFVLVGDGSEKEKLIKEVEKRKMVNVYFLPKVPKRSVPILLKEFDILYIGWLSSPLYKFGISPNKLVDYMLAGKPIVHATSAPYDLVREADCGISVLPNDEQEVAEAILKLSRMSNEERLMMGAKGREFVRRKLPYSYLAGKIIDKIRP